MICSSSCLPNLQLETVLLIRLIKLLSIDSLLMRLDSKDSSFTEISDNQIACHQSRLTELNCVLPKILHLFSTTTLIPFDEIMHFANKNYVNSHW